MNDPFSSKEKILSINDQIFASKKENKDMQLEVIVISLW